MCQYEWYRVLYAQLLGCYAVENIAMLICYFTVRNADPRPFSGSLDNTSHPISTYRRLSTHPSLTAHCVRFNVSIQKNWCYRTFNIDRCGDQIYKYFETPAINVQNQVSNSPECVESIDNGVWKQTINSYVVVSWLWGLWDTDTTMDPPAIKPRK